MKCRKFIDYLSKKDCFMELASQITCHYIGPDEKTRMLNMWKEYDYFI